MMDAGLHIESWWLIVLPIAFALGWIASRVDFRQMLSESRRLPDSYFRGLNFLLNDDHDKAIDAFVEVAKLDTETIELHFALGSLFRRRGEIERAIRVHLSLLNRSDLPYPDQEKALFAIGQDYFKAGMFDRSEDAFKRIVESDTYTIAALRHLLRIYEAVHDWPQAIATVTQLQQQLNEPVPALTHYHCELVEQALQAKVPALSEAIAQLEAAERSAQQAGHHQLSEASTARIAILRAKVAKEQGDTAAHRQYLEQVLAVAPQYGSLVIGALVAQYQEQNDVARARQILVPYLQSHFSVDGFEVLLNFYREYEGDEVAREFAMQTLAHQSDILSLNKFLLSERQALKPMVCDIDLSVVQRIIDRYARRLDRHECQVCGFQAQAFYWQCPGCNQWESFPTQRLAQVSL